MYFILIDDQENNKIVVVEHVAPRPMVMVAVKPIQLVDKGLIETEVLPNIVNLMDFPKSNSVKAVISMTHSVDGGVVVYFDNLTSWGSTVNVSKLLNYFIETCKGRFVSSTSKGLVAVDLERPR